MQKLIVSALTLCIAAAAFSPSASANPALLQQLTNQALPQQQPAQQQPAQQQPAQQQAPVNPLTSMYQAATSEQQACVQREMQKQQKTARTKRGVSRLFQAIGRTAARSRQFEVVGFVNDVFTTAQTADDLVGAAADLGLTEDQVLACLQ